MHKNPAYILYSDPKALNKWGFLYVQFKATMYYFIVPLLLYTLVKGLLIAFGQGNGTAQAITLVIIEAALLIAISIMRPYMDKKTNAFNISIAVVNFFNVLLLLFFTGIFNLPPLAIGVMGVIFFVVNAIFALVILLMVLWASIWALISKNPDTRYQPMRDDRGSFIKSQTNLGTTELDALGATARGDPKLTNAYAERKRMDLDDEEDSYSGSSAPTSQVGQKPMEGANNSSYNQPPRSPVEPPSAPMLRGGEAGGYGAPSYRSQSPVPPGSGYSGNPYNRPTSQSSNLQAPPASRSGAGIDRSANASPWQRGVGY